MGDNVLEHDRVEAAIRQRELPVPQGAGAQPRERTRLIAELNDRAEPVEGRLNSAVHRPRCAAKASGASVTGVCGWACRLACSGWRPVSP
jgi:hypothetical protein